MSTWKAHVDPDRARAVVQPYVGGDPMADLAWVDFWAPDLSFAAAYLARRPVANAVERLLCRQLFTAVRSLGFYLHTEQPHKGIWVRKRAMGLLDAHAQLRA